MPKDPLEEIKKSKSVPVQVHPNDPEVTAALQDFLNANQAPGGASSNEKERVSIQPDDQLLTETPNEAYLKDALIPVQNIDVTEEEKRIFLKTLVLDEPARFAISLFNGEFVCGMRTRTTYEQQRVFDVLNFQVVQKKLEGPEVNYALYMTILQQYFSLLMVEHINKRLFSELTLKPGKSVEEHSAILEAERAKIFNTTNNVRWTAIINAMRVFEAKCAKMSENAANEDFWKPRS